MQIGLRIDSERRHGQFISRVMETGVVWGLRTADGGWAVAPSNQDERVGIYLFWSDRAYAKQCAYEEWAAYEPAEIPLDAFIRAWLPGMDRDGFLAGTNWNAHLIGLEVKPKDLLKELAADA